MKKKGADMLTKEKLTEQLKAMGAPKNSIVIMHSSTLLIGEYDGGRGALLDALVEYFTEDGGLLLIPAHTGRNLYRPGVPTLDLTKREANTSLGGMTREALLHQGYVRTENAVLSLLVFGNRERVEQFVKKDVGITSPSSKDGCYAEIAKQDGYVLLVGVGQESNTFLHSVGEILEIPDRMAKEPTAVSIKYPTGEIVNGYYNMYECKSAGDVSHRFPKYEMAFRYKGCIRDGFIGNAPAQLCSARGMLETVRMIIERSKGIDPLATETAIHPKYFS